MRKLVAVPFLAALLAACGSPSSKPPPTLSVSARGAQGGALVAGALQVTPTLSVSRVRLVVERIDLEPAEAPPMTGSPGGDGGMGTGNGHDVTADHGQGSDDDHPEGEVQVGPFLVDLSGAALTGAVTTAFDTKIPAGSYRELRLDVEPILPADAGADTGLREMALLEASVAIDGTAGTGNAAQAYSVSLPVKVRVKNETPFTVGSGTSNVTVTVDPAAWLAGVTDPTSDAGKALITANVLQSLGVFMDDDHDGKEDHDGGGHD